VGRATNDLEIQQNGPISCVTRHCKYCADFGLIRAIFGFIELSWFFFEDMNSSGSIYRRLGVTEVATIRSEFRIQRPGAGLFAPPAETAEASNRDAGVPVLDASPEEIIS